MAEKITVQDLMECGVHFGHQVKRWNPKMKDFVYGVRNGIHIIDLTKNNGSNFQMHVIFYRKSFTTAAIFFLLVLKDRLKQ